jgi:hypothetical protein
MLASPTNMLAQLPDSWVTQAQTIRLMKSHPSQRELSPSRIIDKPRSQIHTCYVTRRRINGRHQCGGTAILKIATETRLDMRVQLLR